MADAWLACHRCRRPMGVTVPMTDRLMLVCTGCEQRLEIVAPPPREVRGLYPPMPTAEVPERPTQPGRRP